jgi:translocation and assembly module TamA
MKGSVTRTRTALALLAALLAAGCASARPTDRGPEIDSLAIKGNEAIGEGTIRARILTAETSWVPFTEKRYLDEAVLETDLRRIVRLYQAHGYYKARIAETKVDRKHDEVEVLIRVEEGPATRIGRLSFTGLDELPESERKSVLAGLPLTEGAVFAEEPFDRTKATLQQRLREAGYAEAEVEGNATVSLPDDSAEVSVVVDAGRHYQFGRVFVAGANRVPRVRVLERAHEDIKEGAPYSESALSDAESRIFEMGVFSAVKVTRGAPDRRAGTVPVVVDVREAPFRTLRLGAGIGLDRSRQEVPRLIGEWTNRNFFGGLRKLTWSNQLALVFVPNILDGLHDPQPAGSSQLELEQPGFFSPDLSLTTSLGYDRGVYPGLTYHAATGRVGVVWRAGPHFTIVPSYNLSIFKLNAAAEASTDIGQEAVRDQCAISGELCRLAFLEQRFAYDRRDNAVEPTKGFMLALALQEGSHYLGGGFNYLRLLPEARAYFPVGRHVLAARLMGGLLKPAGNEASSVLTRFHLGGGATQRGFGNRGLSPRASPADGAAPTDELDPVGGNGMISGNLEMRWSLPASLGLVTFVDVGEVEPAISDLSVGALNVAVGLGLRYRTMFGPVRFDVGYRLNNPGIPAPTPDQLLYDIPRWSLHFSIGEAF